MGRRVFLLPILIISKKVGDSTLLLVDSFPPLLTGKTFNELIAPLLGTGVFNSDGERWKYVASPHLSPESPSLTFSVNRFHRSMTRPFFTQDRIKHFQIFDRHAKDAIAQMRARFSQGCAVDIQVCQFSSFRIITFD